MSCCKAVATWRKGGKTFVLIQVGETPKTDCPFLLMSDAESMDPEPVSCKEAVNLIINRHEKHLPTEFSPEVENALRSIKLNSWDMAR